MTFEESKQIKNRAQKSVYHDVMVDLIGYRDYHQKKMLENLFDTRLFTFHQHSLYACIELINVLKHFKF